MPNPKDERPSQAIRRSPQYIEACEDLGKRIKRLRQRRNWTLEFAAEQMNLDLTHLQKIEAGTINVTMATLVRISAGFSVEIRTLFAAPNTRE